MVDPPVAEAGIRQLHARFVDAVWRRDTAALGDCFTEDATWHITGTDLHGRAMIEEQMALAFPTFRRILQTYRTPLLTLTDREIDARTRVTEQSVLADGSSYLLIGTYFDRCIDDNGRWRFVWRRFETHYKGPADLSGVWT